jgi:hypothetical protein
MLARMNANQERLREEIKSGQAEMRSTVSAIKKKMDAWIANMRDDQIETVSCQVMTEVCLDSKEPNLEDVESEVEYREVPTEEATVKSSGTMKKQHRVLHLTKCGTLNQDCIVYLLFSTDVPHTVLISLII